MHGKQRVAICLIGAGRMGSRWAAVIARHPRARLAMVVDRDEEAGRSLATTHGARFSNTFSVSVATDPGIEAVLIATPHAFLAPLARRALAAGKHVLVEKPGAKTAVEMKALIRLAARNRVRLMVGFTYRFFAAIQAAKQVVDRGRIGTVHFLRLRHGHAGRPGYATEWRMDRRLAGGGALMDQGVHLLDLVHWFMPAHVTAIESVMSDAFWKTGVEENAFVLFKNARQQTASIHVSITQWKPIFSFEIYGSAGYCQVEGLGRKYGGREILTLGRLKKDRTVVERKIICDPEPANALRAELDEFAAAIRANREPVPSGADALKVLEDVGAIYRRSPL